MSLSNDSYARLLHVSITKDHKYQELVPAYQMGLKLGQALDDHFLSLYSLFVSAALVGRMAELGVRNWGWGYSHVGAFPQVLGIEPWSSERSAGVLNS